MECKNDRVGLTTMARLRKNEDGNRPIAKSKYVLRELTR